MMGKIVETSFRISVAGYFLMALYYFLSKQVGGGDEALFLADLQFISTSGWTAAVQKGISIPYMLLTYPLSLVVEPYIALRGVNLVIFAGLLLYFYRVRGITSLNFYALLLFFFSTVGYFTTGTNDTVFIVAMVIFLVETHYLIVSPEPSSMLWWGIGLVFALFTRALVITFIPVVFLALFLILKNKKVYVRSLIIPLLLGIIFTVLNVPSLSETGSLSYDKKLPPKFTTATWSQRQFYAQQLVNEGKLANYNHPSWKQTQKYLDDNGPSSLPKTVGESLLFDPAVTVKEFFKDFLFIVMYGSRQLGLILAIVFFWWLRGIFKKEEGKSLFLPTALVTMISIFALIIISFVELRWLAPVFIGAIVYFYILSSKEWIPKLWVQANYLLVGLLSLYGIYGMITKL